MLLSDQTDANITTSSFTNKNGHNCEFYFHDISYREPENIIKQRYVDKSKSSGIKSISPGLFKIEAKLLIQQFRSLFNFVLRSKILPTAWKNCIVTPLFKSENTKDPGNY